METFFEISVRQQKKEKGENKVNDTKNCYQNTKEKLMRLKCIWVII